MDGVVVVKKLLLKSLKRKYSRSSKQAAAPFCFLGLPLMGGNSRHLGGTADNSTKMLQTDTTPKDALKTTKVTDRQ